MWRNVRSEWFFVLHGIESSGLLRDKMNFFQAGCLQNVDDLQHPLVGQLSVASEANHGLRSTLGDLLRKSCQVLIGHAGPVPIRLSLRVDVKPYMR